MVDKDDVHIKPFDKPVIAQVTPEFENGMLCLTAPGMDTLRVNINLDNEENIRDLRYCYLRCFDTVFLGP